MAEDNQNGKEVDSVTGVETTGHSWDGIKELNNPAPRWWIWVWLACTIFGVVYWVMYPSWPTMDGNTKGTLAWTQHGQLAAAQQEIADRKEVFLSKFRGKSFDEIKANDELYNFAIAGGATSFKDNCATCHGTGGAGSKGYPNLNDDDWIWGGTADDIYTTIQYGIRSAHDDAKISDMPAFGTDEVLEKEEIADVADYVLSLSGKAEATATGATIFAENCASCHGEDAKGMVELGAPNLADAIWLYGGDRATVIETISNSRKGVMPTWAARLDDNTIRMLTLYVHSLGGGK